MSNPFFLFTTEPVHLSKTVLSCPKSRTEDRIGQVATREKKLPTNALSPATKMATCVFWMKMATAQALGQIGERYAAAWLRSSGWIVRDVSRQAGGADLLACHPYTGETHRFEVKIAKRGKDHRWQFCLRSNGTDISHSDYVIILLMDDHHTLYRYVVPRQIFGQSCKLSLRTHPTRYRGKIAPFLVRGQLNLQDIQTTYDLLELPV